MAWIESHTVLLRHRKVVELALDLALDSVYVMGHLHALWHTVLEQQEDGDISKWSDALIAQAASWKGDARKFVSCLRDRGWIDGHLIHDWIDYVGPYLIKKYSSGNQQKLKDIWLKHGYKYGKGNGKFAKQKATRKRPESDQKATSNRPYLSSPNPSLPNPSSPFRTEPEEEEKKKNCDPPSAVAAVWSRYAESYQARYRTNPLRNAKVNGQIAQFIQRVGAGAAPELAAFYVRHNDQFYVRARHPPGLLLRDAEGLHTQWKTGQTVTSSQARKIDETQGRVSVFQELISERSGEVLDVQTA